MKKWLLGMMAAVMAVSLAACTPTTEKQKEETTTVSAENSEPAVVPTTGGASDKVPRSKCRTCSCYFYLPQRRRRQPGSGDGFS